MHHACRNYDPVPLLLTRVSIVQSPCHSFHYPYYTINLDCKKTSRLPTDSHFLHILERLSLQGGASEGASGNHAIPSSAIFRRNGSPSPSTIRPRASARPFGDSWSGISTRSSKSTCAAATSTDFPNFLDIFRTLNGLLVTFNKRTVKGVPVIPHPFVTTGIMKNLNLLMGAVDADGEYDPGFIDSINANFEGDQEIVRERLLEERVPQILRAAVEAMIEVRRRGMNLRAADLWSARMRARASGWIEGKGLPEPSAVEIQIAGTEYGSAPMAA